MTGSSDVTTATPVTSLPKENEEENQDRDGKKNVARPGSLLQWHRDTAQGRRICTISAAGMRLGGS
jgi:hypothetical protein